MSDFKYEDQIVALEKEACALSVQDPGSYYFVLGALENTPGDTDVVMTHSEVAVASTLLDVSTKTRAFLYDHDLGSNDWPFPNVFQNGLKIGQIAFNGTVVKK